MRWRLCCSGQLNPEVNDQAFWRVNQDDPDMCDVVEREIAVDERKVYSRPSIYAMYYHIILGATPNPLILIPVAEVSLVALLTDLHPVANGLDLITPQTLTDPRSADWYSQTFVLTNSVDPRTIYRLSLHLPCSR
jgi:hypothetical protein